MSEKMRKALSVIFAALLAVLPMLGNSPLYSVFADEGDGLYYQIRTEGFAEGDTYYVEYSYDDGTNWTGAVADGDTAEHTVVEDTSQPFVFELKNVPDLGAEDIVKIKITGQVSSPAMGFLYASLYDQDNETGDLDEKFSYDGDVECNIGGGGDTDIYIIVDVPYYHITLDTNTHDRFLGALATYMDGGNADVVEEANNYLYAYDTTDENETIARLTEELYMRFIESRMFGEFGVWNADPIEGRNNFDDRIQAIGTPYDIHATAADGNDVTISVQDYEVYWGNNDQNGDEIKQIIPVYTLPDVNDILVCMDFDESQGTGTEFYIRSAGDEINSTDDTDYQGYQTRSAVIYADYSDYHTIVAGGNGRMITELSHSGLYSCDCTGMFVGVDLASQIIRVLKPSQNYIVLKEEGETKNVGAIGEGGYATDVVWATGDSAKANVYVGNTSIYLENISGEVDGLTVKTISGVELLDESYADGVTIDATDIAKIKLTFSSNFYDTIPLLIKYTDGTEEKLTICRIGLVIQYAYLDGSGTFSEERTRTLRQDYRDDIQVEIEYDYYQGEQVVVYAYYFHPTSDNTVSGGDELSLFLTYDDGSSEVIGKKQYDAATDDAVACTTFIIGFDATSEFDGTAWINPTTEQTYSKGGFHATVVNSGYNSKTSYGGTQAGSGEGVYWDGKISFFN